MFSDFDPDKDSDSEDENILVNIKERASSFHLKFYQNGRYVLEYF